MSEPTLWERIRIKIAYWLLPWDEPDTLTSLLEARAEYAALKRENEELLEKIALLEHTREMQANALARLREE